MSFPLVLLVLILCFLPFVSPLNLTLLLSPHPSLSSFSALLSLSPSLSSLSPPFSLLAVPNSLLSIPHSSIPISDILRLHFLLSPIPSPSSLPQTLPTLLASTGRYPDSQTSLFLSVNPKTGNVTVNPGDATVIGTVSSNQSGVAIVLIDAFLVPAGLMGTADSDGGAVVSAPPPPVNISKALTESHGFNVFWSILSASGLVDEFERDESGAGLTIFVPTDKAFADIPPSADFQSLTAEQKGVVLRYHCVRSYYPLGSLQAIVNPLQPTLATEVMGAGKYTLNVTSVNGSVILDTGIVQSRVDETVFDENPVAIFGVPVVFLPKEIFGGDAVVSSKRGDGVVEAPAPEEYDASPSPVGEVMSVAAGGRSLGMDLVCIALLYLLV